MTRSGDCEPSDATGSPRPFLIGIGGPSCSGKSTLATHLARQLSGSSAVLSLDAYYKDLSALSFDERARHNFDAPDALDWPLVEEHLNALAQGHAVERPEYDFTTHSRRDTRTAVPRADFILVEGLLALYAENIRALLNLRIYVDAPDAVCLARRIARDTLERGRTRESVLRQYGDFVRPMAERYVRPTRVFADLLINGTAPIDVEPLLAEIRRRLSP